MAPLYIPYRNHQSSNKANSRRNKQTTTQPNQRPNNVEHQNGREGFRFYQMRKKRQRGSRGLYLPWIFFGQDFSLISHLVAEISTNFFFLKTFTKHQEPKQWQNVPMYEASVLPLFQFVTQNKKSKRQKKYPPKPRNVKSTMDRPWNI